MLAMLAQQGALIVAKPDAPPESDIAKILERIAPPICADEFQFSDARPSQQEQA